MIPFGKGLLGRMQHPGGLAAQELLVGFRKVKPILAGDQY